jgi:tetratricopeptide (TPR) repeat protein
MFMNMPSDYDPGLLVSIEENEPTLESPLSILEAPPESPRRPRRPKLPKLHRIPTSALLKYGPWVIGIGGLLALALLSVTTPSWGSIALRDGITLLVAGAGVWGLLWLFYRLHQHWARRRWLMLASSLALVGIVGMALSPTLHMLQGHTLESQGNYQRAIEEYSAGGEHSPNGPNSARAYLEWGQHDLRAQDYGMAVQHLKAAAETYAATPAASQARDPLGTALLQWGRQLAVEQRYGEAIQQFQHLRTRYGNTQAAQEALDTQDEPAAYYAWGQQLQANQQFQAALTQFQAVIKLFADSSYAAMAYDQAASDLYAWAQALTKQAKYSQAIATYQQAIDQYKDAPAAKDAQQALNAPQPVHGRLLFSSGPPDGKVLIRLSSSWSAGANGYVQGGQVYEVRTDANGNFTFPSVLLGRYLIDWQDGSVFTTVLHQGTYNPVYIADVEPLRGTDLGDVLVQE